MVNKVWYCKRIMYNNFINLIPSSVYGPRQHPGLVRSAHPYWSYVSGSDLAVAPDIVVACAYGCHRCSRR